MNAPHRLLAASLFAALCALARADVTLAPLFTDHAVLQRDKPVPVWGRADAGEKIAVTFLAQTHRTTAGADGRWIVFLDALPATTQGADLAVVGKNTLTVRDVVVGEVWLCSGQSNMEFTVDARAGTWQANTRADQAAAEIAAANFPLIRHVRIAQTVAESPADTVKTGGWQSASPQTVGGFPVGDFPINVALHPGGAFVAVLHSGWGQHEVRILNVKTGLAVSQVAIAESFYGLAWSPGGESPFCERRRGGGDPRVCVQRRLSLRASRARAAAGEGAGHSQRAGGRG
jgi:sialate O-acetylesterase